MTSLARISSFSKKIAPLILVIGVLLILVSAIIFRLTKKTPAPLPKPIEEPKLHQELFQRQPVVIFSKSIEFIEKKNLQVYYLEHGKIDQGKGSQVAATFKIIDPQPLVLLNTADGDQFTYEQDSRSLTVSQTSLVFKDISSPPPGSLLSEEELITKAVGYIGTLPLVDKSLKLRSGKPAYLKGFTRASSAPTYEQADLIELSFEKYLEDIPLLDSSPYSSSLTIRLKKNGDIAFLSVRFFESYRQADTYSLKNPREAAEQIRNGEGKITETILFDENGLALEQFQFKPQNVGSIEVNKFYIAYFLPNNIEEPIQPIYVAEAEIKKEDEIGKMTIYLSAIEDLTTPKP